MSMKTDPVPNPDQFKDVPEMRLRDNDVNNILALYATSAELDRISNEPRAKERMRTIKNAWRDFMSARSAISRVAEAIQWTVPMEKRVGLAKSARRCKYVIMQGPLASRPKQNEEEVISVRDLDELCASAWEGRCRMCLETNCNQCALGKILDNTLAQDRGSRSWAMVDIRRRDP